MSEQSANKAPIIYKAEPTLVQSMHKAKENIKGLCDKHLHCRVRVELMDGQMVEGMITGADHRFMYLQVHAPANNAFPARQYPYGYSPYSPYPYPYSYPYYNPAASVILPLVLFDLLAISLL